MTGTTSMTPNAKVEMIADLTRQIHEAIKVQREQLATLGTDSPEALEELDREVAEADALNEMVRRVALGEATQQDRREFERRLLEMVNRVNLRAMVLPKFAN